MLNLTDREELQHRVAEARGVLERLEGLICCLDYNISGADVCFFFLGRGFGKMVHLQIYKDEH